MKFRTPARAEIDGLVRYLANRLDFTAWFSVRGGHGWSVFDCLPVEVELETVEWAVRLGFLESAYSGGSGGYYRYRITRSGLSHAESLTNQTEKAPCHS